MKTMMSIPMILLMLACGQGNLNPSGTPVPEEPEPNTAVFELKAIPVTGGVAGPFKDGKYNMTFSTSTVYEGSYSGLQIEFTFKENEKDDLYLSFELPAAKTFRVYLGEKDVVAEMPAVPFHVTQEDFSGLKNALYETEQSTYIQLLRNHRLAPDHSSVVSFAFDLFELDVTSADFGSKSFSMICSFHGKASAKYSDAVKMDYEISGSFHVKDQEYGIASVD